MLGRTCLRTNRQRRAVPCNANGKAQDQQAACRRLPVYANLDAVARPTLHYNNTQVFKEAQDLMPGGVNSPVRAFRSVGGSPIIFESVKVGTAWCHQQQLDSSVDRAFMPGHD
jgi:hypothetical protein